MKRYLFCIAVVLSIQNNGFAQSYGLTFSSHEVVQEKRTSLDLSPDDSLCFKKNFELSFDLSFLPGHDIYFGYVVRIIGSNNQNIDLIYNQRSASFKVIVGEDFSGISFVVDSMRLLKEWNHFSLQCDLEHHALHFYVNGRPAGNSALSPEASCFKFLWGANDFQKFKTRDIPPMKIKDIRILENGKLEHFWPLDETAGDAGHDKVSNRLAVVKNPVWAKPGYQRWDLVAAFTMKGYSAVAFDAKRDKLYISGYDSLAVYGLKNEQQGMEWFPVRHEEFLLGHQAIYDTIGDKLYDVYIDRKLVNPFNFSRGQWDVAMSPGPVTEFWQANKFIASDTCLYCIGGYGQLRYKNIVQRYRFATQKWDTVKVSGDYFPPRYLAALGTDPQGRSAYIIGGYGSQTGDQMLDPKNYYDLFRYDVRTAAFKKVYSLKPLLTPFTFANSLVVGAKPNTYYGLMFPNDRYNSNLQLIEGSLTDSTFRLVGDPIPYSFHDVQSFADLYYSPLSNKLIAVTLLSSKDEVREKSTEVKIYVLNFPPEPVDAATDVPAGTQSRWRFFLFVLSGLALIALFFLRRIRRALSSGVGPSGVPSTGIHPSGVRSSSLGSSGVGPSGVQPSDVRPSGVRSFFGRIFFGVKNRGISSDSSATAAGAGDTRAGHNRIGDPHIGDPGRNRDEQFLPAAGSYLPEPAERSHHPAIYLFGQFQVFDKEGNDITRLFTPLLKELFLIVVTYTLRDGRGISSEGLNEILWHDKPEKDAKNNRSVNLAKLKIILEKIGNCSIHKESAYWQFQTPDNDIFVDYKEYVVLLQGAAAAGPASNYIHPLVDLIKRGAFLSQTEYNWLDNIKSEISNSTIDLCLAYIRRHDNSKDLEFIIEIANCIFYFDSLNEDALTYKCKSLILLKRHTLASNIYLKFLKEYKDIYGADFGKSFQEIIA